MVHLKKLDDMLKQYPILWKRLDDILLDWVVLQSNPICSQVDDSIESRDNIHYQILKN